MPRVDFDWKYVDPVSVLEPLVLGLMEIDLQREQAETEEQFDYLQGQHDVFRDELRKKEEKFRRWIDNLSL